MNVKEKFDVVINMADGAIGYLENDTENMKIFEVVSNALKKGGKHFMDIMNGSYAENHFPCKLWDEGEKCLTLSAFEWDKKSKILLYGQVDYPYGEPLWKPEMKEGNPIRLYTCSSCQRWRPGAVPIIFPSSGNTWPAIPGGGIVRPAPRH